jgi:hypothetical protein
MRDKARKAAPVGRARLVAGLALGVLRMGHHATAQPLVIDGETIASARAVQAAKAEGALLVYTANFGDSERPLLELFRQDTGIKSEMIRLATGGCSNG